MLWYGREGLGVLSLDSSHVQVVTSVFRELSAAGQGGSFVLTYQGTISDFTRRSIEPDLNDGLEAMDGIQKATSGPDFWVAPGRCQRTMRGSCPQSQQSDQKARSSHISKAWEAKCAI
ncbi:hypothetical protein E4U53_003218 [Claviceps sorghi]|nr:hypothetical protein E4U53_003218 [Claviceps sorghi]